MSRGMSRAERLREMERLYVDRAFTDIEMAERLGVDRITVYKDRALLEDEVPFVEVERGRWKIDRTRYLSSIRLSLHEALALYLPARRAARQTLIAQPHVANALEKLATALKQPMTERLVKAANVILSQSAQPERVAIMETIARGWTERLKVRIAYRGLRARQTGHHLVSPYLIEPALWSDGAYIIGHSDYFDDDAVFKIERIEQATLTRESFDIPEKFDEQELLRYAWGIWRGEGEPERVVLRFAPGEATRRVKESIWHPQQEPIRDLPNGGCEWAAHISEWQEMIPWIRGWGADCEVLEPKELRGALTREAQGLAELYQVVEAGKNQIQYYAHSKKGKDKSEWQPLVEHLTNTADLAQRFGKDADISELARTVALLHDLGKYSKAFQARLDGSPRKVDHATAGARTAIELFNKNDLEKWLATMLAYCVAGHHTGLPDYGSAIDVGGDGTLYARLDPSKTKLEDFSAYKTEIDTATLAMKSRVIKTAKEHQGFSLAFMTRMLYSALVDADFQETETYMNEGEKPRGEHASIEELNRNLSAHLRKFDNPEGDINKKRTETLKACIEKAKSEQGFFTLTVPTGGGKTLASMAFALNHAVRHGLKRVVYVLPFTTIIEQNAAVFKECLGEQNVLEHHSNFDWNPKREDSPESADNETSDVLSKLKLASENWDIPIVVTTNVQFFESLFANRSSHCRKLHNLAKSVIIFDEAQMLPREYLDPCMLAVKELVQNYGTSAVFCTATQPALDKRLPGVKFTDLVPDSQALFDFYKRVQIKNLGKVPDSDLIEKIQAHSQALCIVNTRKHAKGLFDQLEDEGRFHLSTLMCPTHRKETLIKIRELLKSGQPCRVISTQVMEAGIDVDFPVGFRALAGLDSIIQAAGRVNREMKQANSDVYVFDPETPFVKKTPAFIKQGASVAESILRDFSSDPVSVQAINAYFKMLYNLQDPKRAFDVKRILAYFDKESGELDFDFKTAAENFKLIENSTVAVVIPYCEEAKKILEQARHHPYPFKFARRLQMYTVNIYQKEFEALQSKGAIETFNDTYEVLNSMDYYDEKTGIILPSDTGGEALFFE